MMMEQRSASPAADFSGFVDGFFAEGSAAFSELLVTSFCRAAAVKSGSEMMMVKQDDDDDDDVDDGATRSPSALRFKIGFTFPGGSFPSSAPDFGFRTLFFGARLDNFFMSSLLNSNELLTESASLIKSAHDTQLQRCT